MSKKYISIVLTLVMALSMFSINAFAASNISIKLDSNTISTDIPPFIDDNNRTMVPVRFVSEALGAQVEWVPDTRTVNITKGQTAVMLIIDSRQITTNGVATTMDTAAIIVDGRTFVPVRYIAESLGLTVGWESSSTTVTLTSNGSNVSIGQDGIVLDDGSGNILNVDANGNVMIQNGTGGDVDKATFERLFIINGSRVDESIVPQAIFYYVTDKSFKEVVSFMQTGIASVNAVVTVEGEDNGEFSYVGTYGNNNRTIAISVTDEGKDGVCVRVSY